MNPVDSLKAVLCGQDGKCCIAGSQADRDTVDTALASVHHYLDQHKAELPVLPEPYFGSGRYLGEAGSRGAYTTTQIQTYGAACAAHARELALMDAITQVTTLYEKDDYPVLTDICNLIATAK